jgi:hypothetical protein
MQVQCEQCGTEFFKSNADITRTKRHFCSLNCYRRATKKQMVSATLGEVNHPSNVIPLCRNHHWELDHGYLILVGMSGLKPECQI